MPTRILPFFVSCKNPRNMNFPNPRTDTMSPLFSIPLFRSYCLPFTNIFPARKRSVLWVRDSLYALATTASQRLELTTNSSSANCGAACSGHCDLRGHGCMAHLRDMLRQISRHSILTEYITCGIPDNNITKNIPLYSKIHQCAKEISVA